MLVEENGASNAQMNCSELYMDMDITLSRLLFLYMTTSSSKIGNHEEFLIVS